MTVGNAVITLRAVNSLLFTEEGKDRVLPFKTRYKLTRISEALEKEFALYEKERVRLVREYGQAVDPEEGQEVPDKVEVKDPEKLDKFYKELEQVLMTDVDIRYKRLTEDDLESLEDLEVDITDVHMRALMTFVFEKDTPDEPTTSKEE